MLKLIKETDMKALEGHIGEDVYVYVVMYGKQYLVRGVLDSVMMYEFVKIRNFKFIGQNPIKELPIVKYFIEEYGQTIKLLFLWIGIAIQKIENKTVLYRNSLIKDDYNIEATAVVYGLIEFSFGNDVAKKDAELKSALRLDEDSLRVTKAKWN